MSFKVKDLESYSLPVGPESYSTFHHPPTLLPGFTLSSSIPVVFHCSLGTPYGGVHHEPQIFKFI